MKAPAKINLALVVGPRRTGRKARSRHRARASRPRRRDLARGRSRPDGRGIRGGHARPRGAHSTRRGGRRRGALAGRDRQADPSRSGARRWKLRRRRGSSPGQRDASGPACRRTPARARRRPGRRRPVLPHGRPAARDRCRHGPQPARPPARLRRPARPSEPAPRRSRPRRSTTISTARTGSRTGEQRYSPPSKHRDLAALPANDLASSPLAAELRAAGAFRADVSGAGPMVYGLFAETGRAESARELMASRGATWLAQPAW